MLREKTINEFLNTEDSPVYLLDTETGRVVTVEELFNGIRILVDEVRKEEPKVKKTTESQTTDSGKRKRRTAGEIQSAVIKAYDCGNRTITQVMEIAKVDYKTARKYLPISKEG